MFAAIGMFGLWFWVVDSRGEAPQGQLAGLAFLMFLLMLLVAAGLDKLRDLEKRLK